MSDSQTPLIAPPAPSYEPAPTNTTVAKNGFGVAALILGIITLALAAVPFLNYALIGTGALGVVFGIVGLVRKFRPHRAAIAGLIISALGLILAIILVVLYAAIFFGVSKAVDDTNKAAAATHSVVYTVSGDSTDATVTYSTFTDGKSGSSEATNQKLPFSKTETVKGSSKGLSFNTFSITGTNGTTGSSITCKITVDGKVVDTQTSSGQFATADCTGSN